MSDLDPGLPLLTVLSEQAHVFVLAAALFAAFVAGVVAWRAWRRRRPPLEQAIHSQFQRKDQDR